MTGLRIAALATGPCLGLCLCLGLTACTGTGSGGSGKTCGPGRTGTSSNCPAPASPTESGVSVSGYARAGITFSRSLGRISRPVPDDLF